MKKKDIEETIAKLLEKIDNLEKRIRKLELEREQKKRLRRLGLKPT